MPLLESLASLSGVGLSEKPTIQALGAGTVASSARRACPWSRDPSTKVGAVAVRDRRILATGFNGLPTGVVDSTFRLKEDTRLSTPTPRATALLRRCTGVLLNLLSSPVCSACASSIIQAGIRCRHLRLRHPSGWQQS